MTPDDVAALLYRAYVIARVGPHAAPCFPWADIDKSTRADWLAVAEQAIALSPALCDVITLPDGRTAIFASNYSPDDIAALMNAAPADMRRKL